MLLTAFTAGPLAANCYVVGADNSTECVVVDPGMAAFDELCQVLAQHDRTPVAVLLTHGHFDHVADAGKISRRWQIPVYIGAPDKYMLERPLDGLSAEFRELLTTMLGPALHDGTLRPEIVMPINSADKRIELAGITIDILHVPGHTPGSLTYRVAGPIEVLADAPEVLFTGDTLFAGSIGRTDLPGGSSSRIIASIDAELLTRHSDAVVLPGHGPGTTVGAEASNNPFVGQHR